MKSPGSAIHPWEPGTTFLAKHGFPCLIALWGIATLAVQAANSPPSSVIVWGTLSDAFPWNGLSNVVAVDAGELHSVVLKSDGTVGCFGGCSGYITPTNNDAVAVSSGLNYMLALRSSGTLVAWASPWNLSEGGDQVPLDLTNVMAIDAGIDLSVALKEDGTLVRWGQNGTPLPAGLSNVVAVSINSEANPGPGQPNYFHALALKNDGTVVTWGRNDYGEGYLPAGLSNVTAIAAGAYHNVALKSDGTVVAWGGQDAAIRTPPAGLSNVIAIAAGRNHNLALKSDGTVVAWKNSSDTIYGAGVVPTGLSNVVAISAGRFYSVALTRVSAPVIIRQPVSITDRQGNGGTFLVEAGGTPPLTFQWRKGETDIPGATNAIFSYSPEFAAAGDYRVIVRNDSGSVTSQVCTLTIVPWIQILSQPQSTTASAGTNVTLLVGAVGSEPLTYQWRRNDFDIVGANSDSLTLTNVQTEAGTYSVLVSSHGLTVESEPATLTVNGNILPAIVTPPRSETLFIGAKMVFKMVATGAAPLRYQWQKDGNDLGGQTNTTLAFDSVQSGDAGSYVVFVRNDAGTNMSPPALLTIGSRILNLAPPSTVVSIQGPILPAGLTDIVAIAAAARHSLALKSNGTVVAWGDSYLPFYGQNTYSPPPGLSNIVGIAAGSGLGFFDHSLALKDDGTVFGWSGVGLPSAPTVPTDLFGVIAIAAGEHHGLALKADGTVVSWGDSIARVPTGLRNVIAISAGGRRSLALRTDGSVAAWGDLGAPALFNSLTDVSAVAAGGAHIMALRNDGGIVDYFGGSAPTNSAPGGISNVVAIAAGDSHSLALKNDGSVSGWNGAQVPEGLTNVAAISAGRGYSLLLTTNPPAPALGGAIAQEAFLLSAPVSVSGYVLEVTDDLSRPYSVVSNISHSVHTNNPGLLLPASGEKRFYRMRKLP